MEKLKQAHEKVKAHPFRLNKTNWKGYYLLLKKLDKEFTSVLEEKFKILDKKIKEHEKRFI